VTNLSRALVLKPPQALGAQAISRETATRHESRDPSRSGARHNLGKLPACTSFATMKFHHLSISSVRLPSPNSIVFIHLALAIHLPLSQLLLACKIGCCCLLPSRRFATHSFTLLFSASISPSLCFPSTPRPPNISVPCALRVLAHPPPRS
jgi:hypothetical protein